MGLRDFLDDQSDAQREAAGLPFSSAHDDERPRSHKVSSATQDFMALLNARDGAEYGGTLSRRDFD